MTALLLLRAAWCHALSESGEQRPPQPESGPGRHPHVRRVRA